MKIESIDLYELEMELKSAFQTNYGLVKTKKIILIEVKDENGTTGWGEGCAFEVPWYTEETHHSSTYLLKQFLIPLLLGKTIQHPTEVHELLTKFKRNHMAKAAIETAIWDCYAKGVNQPLANILGGTKDEIEVGISIGIQKNTNDLLEKISDSVKQGYRRIKLKLEKGKEIETLTLVREKFPTISLMVDMNSAYTLKDIKLFQSLDTFNLLMLEQPLGDSDFLDHATLRKQIKTPICLDESIHSLEDAKVAIALESCDIINIKLSRVGGLTVAKQIHDLCKKNYIRVWSGGMLETGVGRAHNIALSSLSNFTIPGDISESSRYWDEDITTIPIEMNNGIIPIPKNEGIGYEVNKESLRKYCISHEQFISEASARKDK